MSRSNAREKKKRWSEWINAELNEHGWNAVDLVEASGGELAYNTVYNWVKGIANISSEFVVPVAEAFEVSIVEVIRAGGNDDLADAVARLEAGAPPRRRDEPAKAADPYLRDLMADPAFNDVERTAVINLYVKLERDFDEEQARAARRAVAAEAARALGHSIAEHRNSA